MKWKQNKGGPRFRGLLMVCVQSSVCVLALLIVFMLRLLNREAAEDLSSMFLNAMTQTRVFYAQVSSPPAPKNTTIREYKVAQAKENAEVIPLSTGVLTSGFGERIDPMNGVSTEIHTGVDIAAEEGSPLLAILDGVVKEVGNGVNGYGLYVEIDCEGDRTYMYAHCSSVDVQKGQRVKAGDLIARVGNSGRSTGSHVHIECTLQGAAIDPFLWIDQETYV